MNAVNVKALEAVIADRIVAHGGEPSAHFSEGALLQFNAINDKMQEKYGRHPDELTQREVDMVVAALYAVQPEGITANQIDGVVCPVPENFFEEVIFNLTHYNIPEGPAIAFAANLVARVVNSNTNFRLTLAA